MDSEEYRKKVETEFLKIIEQNLRDQRIDDTRAHEIAKSKSLGI